MLPTPKILALPAPTRLKNAWWNIGFRVWGTSHIHAYQGHTRTLSGLRYLIHPHIPRTYQNTQWCDVAQGLYLILPHICKYVVITPIGRLHVYVYNYMYKDITGQLAVCDQVRAIPYTSTQRPNIARTYQNAGRVRS